MLIDTDVVVKLNFMLCGNCASYLLASYLEAKFLLSSITKHTPFIVDFLVWHKENGKESITQESTNNYLSHLYSIKTKSYADVIRSYVRSFCAYLTQCGLCSTIAFKEKHKGKEDSPLQLHKVYNYYKYLGVSKDADLSDIKKAYHSKARSLHPDVNQDDPKATDRVVALNKMYDILRSENDRLAYDVTMGYVDYDDEYLDSLDGISWHDKDFYFIWI